MTATPEHAAPVLGDRFHIVRRIATGGMAEIFLARQRTLGGLERPVAVKVLKDRFLDDPRVVDMFRAEARIGLALCHPHVVQVFDFGEHEGAPFLAMEYVVGEELATVCRRGLAVGRFLPVEHAVELVRQAADGMGYFHSKRDEDGAPLQIVHRDVSPTNLLVTRDGAAKIIDFGVARTRSTPDLDRAQPGKHNYMAPEQVRGEPLDHRADLFSLGVVLYEITVGKRLFKGRPEEVLQRIARPRIPPPTAVRRGFPPALEEIVMKALEPSPDDRYQSAYELAEDLEEFLREAGLRSGPVKIARYLDDLATAGGGERRAELPEDGEDWPDDEEPDELDFDRLDATRGKTVAASVPAPVAASVPAPVAASVPAPALGAPWFLLAFLAFLAASVAVVMLS